MGPGVNVSWLLQSKILLGAVALAALMSTAIVIFSPLGLPSIRKREADLRALKLELAAKARQNHELMEEVKRLAAKDPELLEALARRQGFARPGETIYTFRDPNTK